MKPALAFSAFLALAVTVGCSSSNALRNDAYDYYGLGNSKPTKIEISYSDQPGTTIGTRTIVLKTQKDGKETYEQQHGEALANEGNITLSLEPDGIYAMSSTKGKLKSHSLEMPAKLEVGGGWQDHTEIEQQGQSIKLDNDVKVLRKERVSTKGGTFDEALYVESTGKGTIGSQDVTLKTKSWYVRGRGPVKQIVEVSPKQGPGRTISMELAAETATPPPDEPSKTK